MMCRRLASRVICQLVAVHAHGWHHADTELGPSCPRAPLTSGAMLCKEGESAAMGGPAQPSCAYSNQSSVRPANLAGIARLPPQREQVRCSPDPEMLMKNEDENHRP